MKPGIETAKKIADALEISLDYLAGNGDSKMINKKTLERLENIDNLQEEDRQHILYTIDNLIKAAKFKTL
jgi:transcriptional regulator with XRE-family HTH domain